MKKLKLLCFVLAFVFVIPLGLTACNDSGDGDSNVTNIGQILSHKQEFVDFSLAVSGYETQDQEYNALKQESVETINVFAANIPQFELDMFVSEFLGASEIKGSFLTNYFKMATDYIKASNALGKKAQAISLSGGLNADLQDSLLSVYYNHDYTVLKGQIETSADILSYGGSNILSFATMGESIVSVLSAEMIELEKNKIALTSEYEALWAEFNKVYDLAIELSGYVQEFYAIYVKTMVNLAVAQNCQELIRASLDPETLITFEEIMSTLLNDYGLQNNQVRNAYLDFMLNFEGYSLKLEYEILKSIDFNLLAKTIKDFVDASSTVSVEQAEDIAFLIYTKSTFRKDIFDILKKVGNAISNNFISDNEKNSLVNSANLLNQNGLGLFMEKYLDLYRYAINFTGHALTNFTEQEFLDIFNAGMAILGNGEKAQALTYKLSADTILRLYNSYGKKDNFKRSFNDNQKFDSLISNLSAISNTLTKDDITDQFGDMSYSQITVEHISDINTYFSNIENIALSWSLQNQTHIQNGIAELQRFSEPLMAFYPQGLLESFFPSI